ncbi:MAG: CRISPR-associated endoribonuclease Cas6 [Elusimicrobiota bacterium]|nr:CRISPR-associated endoribonuclease Cas6 [Endomicrobiia bacterium]MDW8166273.1 CRISPR-associated endoribonuclease Cas6 [Elusimicrobiota bacterium]
MRIKINFYSPTQVSIPINYQHYLSSAIYNFLEINNKKFATLLHNGDHISTSKKFKFFTFSWLQIPKRKIIDSKIEILSNEFFWYISSPWEEFLINLLNGLLKEGSLRIGDKKFEIKQIETMSDFDKLSSFKKIKFKCLSPIVITTKKQIDNRPAKYYYKPDDDKLEISEKIRQNLINKYKTFYNKNPKDENLIINFDENYIKSSKAQVLVHYIKNKLDIKIPAIMCPFEAEGSQDLIRFGYECGFGELNSAGFGMVGRI